MVPPGVPLLAATATITPNIRSEIVDKLDMKGCEMVSVSPDRPNIYYEVKRCSTIEEDLQPLVDLLRAERNKANRVIVYCRSLNTVANLYVHFLYTFGAESYHPLGAEQISDNRLFGMYHANTSAHNKAVIQASMQDPHGVVQVIFATVALGMGVNLVGVNTTIHYGAPTCIEDYYQESGRAGRSGDQAKSIIFWKPADVPLRKDQSILANVALACVRHYVENTSECRRVQLLCYFDPDLIKTLHHYDHLLCCDVCASSVAIHHDLTGRN